MSYAILTRSTMAEQDKNYSVVFPIAIWRWFLFLFFKKEDIFSLKKSFKKM